MGRNHSQSHWRGFPNTGGRSFVNMLLFLFAKEVNKASSLVTWLSLLCQLHLPFLAGGPVISWCCVSPSVPLLSLSALPGMRLSPTVVLLVWLTPLLLPNLSDLAQASFLRSPFWPTLPNLGQYQAWPLVFIWQHGLTSTSPLITIYGSNIFVEWDIFKFMLPVQRVSTRQRKEEMKQTLLWMEYRLWLKKSLRKRDIINHCHENLLSSALWIYMQISIRKTVIFLLQKKGRTWWENVGKGALQMREMHASNDYNKKGKWPV